MKPAESKVVFVSESGSMTNGGTSPRDAVKTLAHAVTMLPEGGTVVVSGVTEEGITVLPKTNGKVTVTSTYDGVDYAATAGAKLRLAGTFLIGWDPGVPRPGPDTLTLCTIRTATVSTAAITMSLSATD